MVQMRKIIVICICLFISTNTFAQNHKNPFKKNKFSASISTSMVYAYNMVHPYSKSSENTINQISANLKNDYLDFYGYIDIYDIFYLFEDKKYVFGQINNYLYGELNPRFSIGDLFGYKLSYSIFDGIYMGYNFTFDSNDLLHHYFGLGINLKIPIFSYIKIDWYARYIQKYYNRPKDEFNGYLLDISYELPIYKFKTGIDILYAGRFKYIFDAKISGISDASSDSIRWQNDFKIGYNGFYIGYSYIYNKNFMELKGSLSNKDEQRAGLYYTYKF